MCELLLPLQQYFKERLSIGIQKGEKCRGGGGGGGGRGIRGMGVECEYMYAIHHYWALRLCLFPNYIFTFPHSWNAAKMQPIQGGKTLLF